MTRMSFAILRHGKIKNTSRGVAIAHNHRLGNVDQVNIDKDMKHLNRCFMGDGLAERIAGKLPAKVRKDAVVSVEVLLTSGPEFFDGIEPDREKLAKNPTFLAWLAKSLDWAKKEFGGNLVDATLHMDESTPHLHLMAVPITKDGRLCAKEIMARTEMQRRQTGYAEAMKMFGLVRGEPATETKRRHIGLKEEAGSGGKAAQLEAQLVKARADLARLRKLSKEWSDVDLAKVKSLEEKLALALLERDSLKTEVEKMDEYTKTLNTKLAKADEKIAAGLIDKAAEIEALVQAGIKSNALLKTAVGHRAAAEKLTQKLTVDLPAPNEVLVAVDKILVEQAKERTKTAQDAFLAEWPAIGRATPLDAQVGTPVAVFGHLVVLHVGRGRHVLHEVPKSQEPPKLNQTQQHKPGVSR